MSILNTSDPISKRHLIWSVARIVNEKEQFWHNLLPRTGPFSITIALPKNGTFAAFDRFTADEIRTYRAAEAISSDIICARKREQNALLITDIPDGIIWGWQ